MRSLLLVVALAAQMVDGRVTRVVDGDTVVVEVRVRLAGIDTPETVHPRRGVERCGPEATAATRGALEGQRVRLGIHRENVADRYGRLIADVKVDEKSWNVELVRRGLARAVFRWPLKGPDRLRRAERAAETAGRGVWSGGRACHAE